MKIKWLIFQLLLCITSISVAQDKDIEAQYHYAKAESYYNESKFGNALFELYACDSVLGKPNSKILYLRIKSWKAYYDQTFDTAAISSGLWDIDLFFSITNQETYPREKYLEIIGIKKAFQASRTEDKYIQDFTRIENQIASLKEQRKWKEAFALYEKTLETASEKEYMTLNYCYSIIDYLYTPEGESDNDKDRLRSKLKSLLQEGIRSGSKLSLQILGIFLYNEGVGLENKRAQAINPKDKKQLADQLIPVAKEAIGYLEEYLSYIDNLSEAAKTNQKGQYKYTVSILIGLCEMVGDKDRLAKYEKKYNSL